MFLQDVYIYIMLCVCLGSLRCDRCYVEQGHKAACSLGFLSLCSLECGLNSRGCLFAWLLSLHSLLCRPSTQGCLLAFVAQGAFLSIQTKCTLLLVCFKGSLDCIPWCLELLYMTACLLGFLILSSLVSGPNRQGCLFAWVAQVVFLGFWAKYTMLFVCQGYLAYVLWSVDYIHEGA